MKRFLLFAGKTGSVFGGWCNFVDDYDTLDRAKSHVLISADWWHVVDLERRVIVYLKDKYGIQRELREVRHCTGCKHHMEHPVDWKDATGASFEGRKCLTGSCDGKYVFVETAMRDIEAAWGSLECTGTATFPESTGTGIPVDEWEKRFRR